MSCLKIINEFEKRGGNIVGKNICPSEDGELVALVSNDMSLTGAPVALMYMALVLQRKGFFPIIISPKEGSLTRDINAYDLPVIIAPSEKIGEMILSVKEDFSFVVVNTAENAGIVSELNGTGIPVLWWLHESHSFFTEELLACMPMHLFDNVRVAAVGQRCLEFIKSKRPRYVVEELIYTIPDCRVNTNTEKECRDNKKRIALIGSLEYRKGQDILLEAISKLPENLREKSQIFFIGRSLSKDITKVIIDAADNNSNIEYSHELGREEIMNVYENIDCLVCASRDDPMPVVVTEACMFSKLIICSSNTGSADLLKRYDAGLIYYNNDAEGLRDCLIRFLEEDESVLNEMRRNARKVYEQLFSEIVFEYRINKSIKILNDKRNVCSTDDRTMALLLRDCEKERRKLIECRKENEHLKESLEIMRNATLWKASKPIRTILDTLKHR